MIQITVNHSGRNFDETFSARNVDEAATALTLLIESGYRVVEIIQ